MVQQVKDLVVLSLLWYRFNPWPVNFHMLWVWQNKQTNEQQQKHTHTQKKTKSEKHKNNSQVNI